ncbi:MAG: CHAD domain-containing protein, partial [Stellaceae bacterium]
PVLLDRRRRRVKKRSRGFARQSPEQRHRVRIALKKWRYTAEIFAGLYDPAETRRFIQGLKRLQDRLGDANDLQTGRRLIDELARGRHSPPAQAGHHILGWHAHRLADDEARLHAQIRELNRAPRFWRPAAEAVSTAPAG